MSTYFLAIQNDYTTIQLALFDANRLCLFTEEDKRRASKCIIPLCSNLLREQSLSLSDLSFIAVNQGPGPFTTLRTVIASMNGISFATGLPLIGVDSLKAFAQEQYNSAYPYTVILLNAFTRDVYYALDVKGKELETGCKPITILLEVLRHSIPPEQAICFIGGGVELHRGLILEEFKERAVIPEPNPEGCSIAQIASTALECWNKKENISQQLFPLYLKRTTAKKRAP